MSIISSCSPFRDLPLPGIGRLAGKRGVSGEGKQPGLPDAVDQRFSRFLAETQDGAKPARAADLARGTHTHESGAFTATAPAAAANQAVESQAPEPIPVEGSKWYESESRGKWFSDEPFDTNAPPGEPVYAEEGIWRYGDDGWFLDAYARKIGGLGGMGLVGVEIAFSHRNGYILPATMDDISAIYDREFKDFISRAEMLAASMGARFEGVSWENGYGKPGFFDLFAPGMAVLTFSREIGNWQPKDDLDPFSFQPFTYWENGKQRETFQISWFPGYEHFVPTAMDSAYAKVSSWASDGPAGMAFRQELSDLTLLANRMMACGALLDLAAKDSGFAARYEASPADAIKQLNNKAQTGLPGQYGGTNQMEGVFIYCQDGAWKQESGVPRPGPWTDAGTPDYVNRLLSVNEQKWLRPK
jgi:hypothetical protein